MLRWSLFHGSVGHQAARDLKMMTQATVENMIDKIYVVVLGISRISSIPNNSIHQCLHLHMYFSIQLILIFCTRYCNDLYGQTAGITSDLVE